MKALTIGTLRRRRSPADPEWRLRLYIAGNTPKSTAALDNLRRICEEHLAGKYEIEVVDLIQHPQLARGDQILAADTRAETAAAPAPDHW